MSVCSLTIGSAKEEQSGGTADRSPKIQTTNLVGPFKWSFFIEAGLDGSGKNKKS